MWPFQFVNGMSAPTFARAIGPLVGRIDSLCATAGRRVDASSAAVFRIAFGVLAFVAVCRFFLNGWIDALYVSPAHHMKYMWFEWVQPLPDLGMQLHFVLLGILAICIAVGLFYRWCVALFCIGFLYVELLDAVTYLNHYYWLSLTGALMIFLPLNRKWSLDAWRAGHGNTATTIPVSVLWLLRAQLVAVYVFGGIAKLNPDWLFNAMPLMIWLNQHGDYPVIGALLQQTWVAYAMSWAGAAFDLTIMLWMSLDNTRRFAYPILIAFHLITWQLFPSLGMFPWLMIACTLIFFKPDWPVRVLEVISHTSAHVRRCVNVLPFNAPTTRFGKPSIQHAQPVVHQEPTVLQRIAVVACAVIVVFQVAIPLRHWLYPGNVRWSEEGYRYAWRMMLSEKVGNVSFRVTDPQSGESWRVQPARYLSPLQVERTAIDPDMIQQTAHIIAADYESNGYAGVEVRADAFVAFNGRPYKRLIDPTTDLAAESRTVWSKDWILPEP